MILGDFGTSYYKILDLGGSSLVPDVFQSKDLDHSYQVDLATGHNGKRRAKRYVNELTALARGGIALTGKSDFTLMDCGSRDIKFVRYKDNRLHDMGWNAECGASMGFTIELLQKYYSIDFRELSVPDKSFSVTCGVLGMSNIFDTIISGLPASEAVVRFVKGIALNAFRFCGSPSTLYLSGGLCENSVFVGSIPAQVIPLGRFVLLDGLMQIAGEKKEERFFQSFIDGKSS